MAWGAHFKAAILNPHFKESYFEQTPLSSLRERGAQPWYLSGEDEIFFLRFDLFI